ncbi:RNA-binding S4 domain-containing protein [Methylopila henanensis]|uniref:RNA-binding S4 domain-containing protein n=1 Tax=Methylopila henanensis TaxID=873516 RepID=A0ABW4KCA4_9HYPH
MRRPEETPPERLRIDVWLWRARVARTRALAVGLVQSGHVRVNGQRVRAPGHALKRGDVLTIALSAAVRVLRVVDFGERRGPATEARALFDDLGPHQGENAAPQDGRLE